MGYCKTGSNPTLAGGNHSDPRLVWRWILAEELVCSFSVPSGSRRRVEDHPTAPIWNEVEREAKAVGFVVSLRRLVLAIDFASPAPRFFFR